MKSKYLKLSFYLLLAYIIIISISEYSHFKRQNFKCLSWDTYGYYLYLPSTLIYHDLGLEKTFLLDSLNKEYSSTETFYQFSPGKDGKNVNKYSSGLSVIFLPFFSTAHLIAKVFGYNPDGFSAPYQWLIYLSFWFFCLLGIFLTYKLLNQLFKPNVVFYTLLFFFFGTNIFFLMGFPMSIHVYLYTLYIALLLLSIKWNSSPTIKNSILLGFISGLIVLVRPTDIIALVIPFLWNVYSKESLKVKINFLLINWVKVLLAITMASIMIIPQLLYWKFSTGDWLYNSYTNPGEGLDFFNPHTLDFLFSFRKGWLLYTPLMIFSIVGFIFVFKQKRDIFFPLFVYFLINLYLVSAWTNWWYAGSFSSRAIAQSYSIMIIPLGFFIYKALSLKLLYRSLIFIVMSFFVFLNLFQTWQYKERIINPERMTKKYYLSTFFQTSPVNEATKKLLLVERSASGIDTICSSEDYLQSKLLNVNYLNDLSIDNSRKVNPDSSIDCKGILLDSLNIFTPAFRIKYSDITHYDHAYIKITASIFPTQSLENNPINLVTTFEYEGSCYNYQAQTPVLKDSLVLNKWNKVEFVYLTPEPRSFGDNFTTYFWLRGNSKVYVSNITIQIFEPVSYGLKVL